MIEHKKKRIYCFDTSSFLALSRTNENVIRIPESLWGHLEEMMKAGELISHRIVYDEIMSGTKNPPFIMQWLKDKKAFFLSKTDAQRGAIPDIVKRFPDLIDAKRENEQADPWLIALAMEKSAEETLFDVCVSIVVSQENPNSSKKIPAACKHFGIQHRSLREYFDEQKLATDLQRVS
jgi:Domain of unknown function (DUF4411)